MDSGIYRILNKANGKVYIGSSQDLRYRFRKHRTRLAAGTHDNPHLQSAWNKYGEDSFEFEILELVPNRELLLSREQHWIDSVGCASRTLGYNILPTAGSRLGSTHSEETKAKISKSGKGLTRSAETRRRMSVAFTGRTMSPEARAKLSEIAKKRVGEKSGRCTITEQDALNILSCLSEGLGTRETSEFLGIKYNIVAKIKYNKTWKHLPRQEGGSPWERIRNT